MNTITTKLVAPEGYEYGGFNEETREVEWRPKRKPLGEIERKGGLDYRTISEYGNIDERSDRFGHLSNSSHAFGNYFPVDTVPLEEVRIIRDYWQVVMKVRRIEWELNPEGWKPDWTLERGWFYYGIVYNVNESEWRTMGAGVHIRHYLGQFHSQRAAEQCLDALDDDDRRALLRFWRVGV